MGIKDNQSCSESRRSGGERHTDHVYVKMSSSISSFRSQILQNIEFKNCRLVVRPLKEKTIINICAQSNFTP